MKIFCVVTVLFLFVLGGIADAQTRLDMRLAESQPGAGLVETTIAHSDRKVYVHDVSVITNADVVEARVAPADATTFNVVLRLTAEGATRLQNATRSHIGRPIAILVNGTALSAPTVRAAIGQDAVISGGLTRAEADELVAGLIGR